MVIQLQVPSFSHSPVVNRLCQMGSGEEQVPLGRRLASAQCLLLPLLPCPALPEGRCPPGEERRGFVPPAGSLWRSLLKGTLCIIAFFLLFIFFFFSIFLDVSKLGTAFCEGKFCWLNFFVA